MDSQQERIAARVLRAKPGRVLKKPISSPGDDDPESKAFISTLADLNEHGNPKLVCDTILSRLRAAAQVRSSVEDEWRKALRAWFQLPSEFREVEAWESDRYLPVILKQVETALPSIIAATLDDKGVFRFSGLTTLAKDNAKVMQALVNFQVANFDYDEAYEDMYWWACLLGTAIVDHGWDYKERERLVAETNEDEEGNPTKDDIERVVTVDDQPRVSCLNPFDVWLAPSTVVGEKCPWLIERVETTIDELRDMAATEIDGEPPHIDSEALEEWIKEEQPHKQPIDSDEHTTWFDNATQSMSFQELIEEMGYDYDGDEETYTEDSLTGSRVVVVLVYRSGEEQVTLGSPRHIIGYSKNPNRHGLTGVVVHHFFKVPNFPYGRGIGTILQGHQELANENINAHMDTANLERMSPLLLDMSRANLMDDELVLQPNAVLRGRGNDFIRRLELPAPTALAMNTDAHLMRDADDLTGFSEQARGMAPSSGQTATAFQGIQSNLRTRLITHVRRSARTLKRSARLLMELNQQWYEKEEIVEMTGPDGLEYVEVSPDKITGKFAISVSISTSRASPEMRAQNLLGLYGQMVPLFLNGAMQNPQVRRMTRVVLEAFEYEDVDSVLPKGAEKIKDAGVENILLAQKTPIAVNPAEPHDVHIQSHRQYLQELAQEGITDQEIINAFTDHIEEHAQAQAQAAAAQQMQAQQAAGGQGTPAQNAQGASQAGLGPGGGDPTRQGATLASRATGGQGTPGVGAPGPVAPGQQR